MRSEMVLPGGLLALLWGLLYSLFLWHTRPGRWLRLRETWVSVVVGVGGNLAALGLVLDVMTMLVVAGAFGLSGACVVAHSLFASEYREHVEMMERRTRGGGE